MAEPRPETTEAWTEWLTDNIDSRYNSTELVCRFVEYMIEKERERVQENIEKALEILGRIDKLAGNV